MTKYYVILQVLFVSSNCNGYNTLQVQTVLKSIKNKTALNASRCDFRGLGTQFSGVNFSGANLSGALFNQNNTQEYPTVGTVKIPGQTSDLSGANFTGAQLISTGFAGANLTGAIFTKADINYADFSNANLTGAATLDQALNIGNARFSGATMPDGSKMAKGGTWKSPSGVIFNAHDSN